MPLTDEAKTQARDLRNAGTIQGDDLEWYYFTLWTLDQECQNAIKSRDELKAKVQAYEAKVGKICRSDHCEIAYEGAECPLCDMYIDLLMLKEATSNMMEAAKEYIDDRAGFEAVIKEYQSVRERNM